MVLLQRLHIHLQVSGEGSCDNGRLFRISSAEDADDVQHIVDEVGLDLTYHYTAPHFLQFHLLSLYLNGMALQFKFSLLVYSDEDHKDKDGRTKEPGLPTCHKVYGG